MAARAKTGEKTVTDVAVQDEVGWGPEDHCPAGTVWLLFNAQEFHVEVGSEAWRKLVDESAAPLKGCSTRYTMSRDTLRQEAHVARLEIAEDADAHRSDLLLDLETFAPLLGSDNDGEG